MKCPKCHFENPDDTLYCGKCATPLKEEVSVSHTETLETPVEELTTGSTFAVRCQIIEDLGKGKIGRIYQVLDIKLSEEVDSRLIQIDMASDIKILELLRNV